MDTTIDAHSFDKTNEALFHMSKALEVIQLHLNGLPHEEGVKIPKWVELQVSGLSSTLKCFSVLCSKMAEDAERWKEWAEKEKSVFDC